MSAFKQNLVKKLGCKNCTYIKFPEEERTQFTKWHCQCSIALHHHIHVAQLLTAQVPPTFKSWRKTGKLRHRCK